MWNEKKLDDLRRRYGDDNDGGVHDPRFRRVAEKVFSGGTRSPPYAGVPTLLDAPYLAVDRAAPDFGDLQVAMLGVPMDLGVTNRPGARFGPRALRAIERIGPYNHALDCAPVFDLRVADIGDVPMRSRYRLEQCIDDIECYATRLVDAGVTPLSVGGDHSVTFPLLKAVAHRYGPVGLVHIDAHCDTGGPFDECKFHHGGPFRNAVLAGALDPTRTIQIGIRGSSEYLWEFSYASGMTVVHAEDVAARGVPAVVEQALKIVGDGATYVSFDIDGVDPSYAPGTGTPEVGGLTSREALALLRGLKGLNVIGGDVMEVAPEYDATHNTAHVAAQVLFEILSLMVFSPSIGQTGKGGLGGTGSVS